MAGSPLLFAGGTALYLAGRSRIFRHSLRREKPLAAEHATERAADADFALDVEVRLVELQHVLDDRQPKARAAGFARTARRHAIEALGDARQVLGRDAVARIGDRETRAAVLRRLPGDLDAAAFRRVAHGVRNEIRERAVQIVGLTSQIGFAGAHEMDALAALRKTLGLAAQAREQGAHGHAV